MKRRQFIRNLTYAGTAGLTLGGFPVNILAGNSGFKKLAMDSDNDKVLVFIQLHGGNDALNTIIPVSQYNEYYNLRPNIAIPDNGTRRYINLDSGVEDMQQVGLHPDMHTIKAMYDEGKVAIVQNVGYPDMNLSHFRGRDIVFMGGDAQSNYNSGWMGRYLDYNYPGYPDAYPNKGMPDPIGIELSGNLSLAFHREAGIPIGLNIGNPEQFYQLINSVGVDPPIGFPDSHAGDELRYIMDFEKKSNQYAGRLRDVYNAGSNSLVVYPESYPNSTPDNYNRNPLSPQLKLIARLLKGGVKTKIFLVRMGGFDTHGEQVETYDSTLGLHSSLLYHMSSAVKAFYHDLKNLGVDDKVLSITFTEFGRRAYSNASYGTDHGTSTPVFVFGTKLNPGLYGLNPDLNDLHNGNLKYDIDYRQIYTSIVQDWFNADNEALRQTGFNEWIGKKIPLLGNGTSIPGDMTYISGLGIYPNPAEKQVQLSFQLERKEVCNISLFNAGGTQIKSYSVQGYYGENHQELNIEEYPAGVYFVRVNSSKRVFNRKFIKVR